MRRGKAESELESLGQVAVKSKRQGDAVDYRIIARSEGPLTSEDFESAYRELSVGALPPASAGEAEPWITVGSFDRSEKHYVAVIRQEWTDRQDIHGRPVAAQYCLCVPDSVIIEQGPSYTNLCAKIPPEQYFLGTKKQPLDDPEVALAPLSQEVKEILSFINEVGFDFCSSVASLLLASPIAIMSGHQLSVETRLRFFDAVASLLPYGSRTDLGVSTWMNSTTVGKIHLGFSDAVLPDQKRVVWMEAATKELEANPLASNYHKLLHKLWHDAQADKEQIINDLASMRTPLHFRDAQAIFKALRDVNWEKHVYEEVKKEQGKKEEVRELLKSKKRKRLTDEKVGELLLFLLDESPLELEDIKILRENWDESFWVPASDKVKGELQYPTFQEDVLWALCRVAAEQDWLEKFLDALLDPEKITSTLPTLQLFHRAISEFKYNRSRVSYLLLRNPRLLYEFLFMVGGSHETHSELEDILLWLEEDETSKDVELSAFRIAVGLSDLEATPEMIASLARLDESYVEKLFRIAQTRLHQTRNHLPIWRLTSAVSDWLFGRLSSIREEEAAKWREHLRLMVNFPHTSMHLITQLDMISLALRVEDDDPPPLIDYLHEEQPAKTREYGEQFVHNLACAAFDSHQLIERLIGYLDKHSLNVTAASNDMYLMASLMPRINREHVKNRLITHLAHNIRTHPSLLSHEAFEQVVRKRLLDWGKEKHLLEILQSAFTTAVHSRESVEQVVQLYLQMSELEMPQLEERVKTAFSESNYLDDLDQIDCFVDTLHAALAQATDTPEMAESQIKVLQKSLMSINSPAMTQYRERYVNNLIATLMSASELLSLTEQVLDDAQENDVRQLLDKMRESLPGPGFFGFRGRKRSGKAS